MTNAIVIGLWAGILLLPLKGAGFSAVFAVAVSLILAVYKPLFGIIKNLLPKPVPRTTQKASRFNATYAVVSIIAVLLILPLLANDYILDVLILAGIYAILALGLNVVMGYTGLLNLGFVAFYAVGAYSFALLNTKLGLGYWSALPFALILSGLSGFVMGFPALRLKGDYLAIVTLGFGEITRLVLNNWDSFTNGPNGISSISRPAIGSMQFVSLNTFYYFVLFAVILSAVVIRRVERSAIGRAWISIREDEIAASSMGVDTTRYKLYSFSFGAFFAGLAGTIYASKMQFINPESFTFTESILVLSMVILGGLGSVQGAITGAAVLVVLPEILREIKDYRMLSLGAGLVLLMIFRPQGIFGGRGVFDRD